MQPRPKGLFTMLFRETDHASVDWDNPDAPVVLDSHGLLAAPGETLESYAERIDELFLTRARFDASASIPCQISLPAEKYCVCW